MFVLSYYLSYRLEHRAGSIGLGPVRENHCLSSERAAVVKLDVLAQVKSPYSTLVAVFPGGRQSGLDIQVRAPAYQCLVHLRPYESGVSIRKSIQIPVVHVSTNAYHQQSL